MNKLFKFYQSIVSFLFIIFTIPMVFTSIFGNGNANAQFICESIDGSDKLNITHAGGGPETNINAFMRESSFCGVVGGGGADSRDCANKNLKINNTLICHLNNNWCKFRIGEVSQILCKDLNKTQCETAFKYNRNCYVSYLSTDSNKLVEAVCRVYKIATGTAGKAFAAIGVISVGIGFFTGKVSWGLMISVAAGIAVFFGAPSIIAVISGDDTAGMCSSY